MSVYNRAYTPKSEEPVLLLQRGLGWVPSDGFVVTSGRNHPRQEQDEHFIVPVAESGITKEIPENAYLRFADTALDHAALFGIANEFGFLGLPEHHFHATADGALGSGESLDDWALEIGTFQDWFQVNELLCTIRDEQGRTGAAAENRAKALIGNLRDKLRRMNCVQPTSRIVNAVDLASRRLVSVINDHLNPGILTIRSVECLFPGCPFSSRGTTVDLPSTRARISPHVVYHLRVSSSGTAEPKVTPSSLLSAIWLQFSELVAGSRKIRKCDVCGRWMDISETARPNAKRMHDRCGKTKRQSRWRATSAVT